MGFECGVRCERGCILCRCEDDDHFKLTHPKPLTSATNYFIVKIRYNSRNYIKWIRYAKNKKYSCYCTR
ncbi:hypothetical protein BN3087_280018 [Sulfurovum sp. enrichment culture clone C5]|uniref:Uncharacterized protein n=1 Tax=Sulfurovum sp. enrichment culture clone C5 TaxID=497650 RepID=A0A0S4XNL6_9BACT|nr:hypothetical protein BN3087_280018 [Sulfurovum sp. enrichment culture clone C5]